MGDLFDKCAAFVEADQLRAVELYPYFRAIRNSEGTEVEIAGKKLVMAGSNNYLGLTHDPRVKRAAMEAVERFGSGCTGSRFLNGTLELHEELEEALARFVDREEALTFSTGFQTNLGIISALVGRDDVVLCDRDNHASIIDGCRLSFGQVKKFRHSDMADLEEKLASTPEDRGKLIVVDGVFSMAADIAPLPEICDLAEKYGARILVDEAHSLGVLGKRGRGAVEHCGVEDRVDLVMGTFSKSLASLGGFVAGRAKVIDYIRHKARALIFSASIAPSSAAAALEALRVLQAEPQRRHRLERASIAVRKRLRASGLRVLGDITPIIPIVVGEQRKTFAVWKRLNERGLFTNPVVAPAVPPGLDLIRASLMSTHSDAQIDFLVDTAVGVGREFGLTQVDPRESTDRIAANF